MLDEMQRYKFITVKEYMKIENIFNMKIFIHQFCYMNFFFIIEIFIRVQGGKLNFYSNEIIFTLIILEKLNHRLLLGLNLGELAENYLMKNHTRSFVLLR